MDLVRTLNTLNYMLTRHTYNKEQEEALKGCKEMIEDMIVVGEIMPDGIRQGMDGKKVGSV